MRYLAFALCGVLAAGAALAAATFTSADGQVKLTLQDDGAVVTPEGKTILTVGADGSLCRPDGKGGATVKGDTVFNRRGEPRATVEADGTVVIRRELGRIDGTGVYGANGELLGTLSDTSDAARQLGLMAIMRAHHGGRKGHGPGGPGGGKGRGAPPGNASPPDDF